MGVTELAPSSHNSKESRREKGGSNSFSTHPVTSRAGAEGDPKNGDSLVPLVTSVRWGTTCLGLLWAVALRSRPLVLGIGIALLAYSIFRTAKPVEYRRPGWKNLLSILVELAFSVAIVVGSDCWESPYIFSLFTPVIAAGFAQGYGHALRIAITAGASVGLAAFLLHRPTGMRPMVGWSGELLLVAAVASYGRHLLRRAQQVGALNLNQLWRLNEANELLMSLNQLSHDLPLSFDFQDTVLNAVSRAQEVARPDTTALLLLDPINSQWNVALAEGARLPESYPRDQLPVAAQRAAGDANPLLVRDIHPHEAFVGSSKVGLYIPLWAGSRQVGLLAVESEDRECFGPTEAALLAELAEPVALTIDNARWFDRLRARGAHQERTRIARDLHDRVGQGVAYVAFELDRLTESARDTELASDLDRLRDDARNIVRELRETLYDLRTDVSDEHGFMETVTEFLQRVESRSGVTTTFHHDASRRLPLVEEREVWRIAQEAIVNAERHARAQNITVSWNLDENRGMLTVADDGVGLHSPQGSGSVDGSGYGQPASPGRPSYGLTGMRERAEALGALLSIESVQPTGTLVTLIAGHRPIAPRNRIDEELSDNRERNG